MNFFQLILYLLEIFKVENSSCLKSNIGWSKHYKFSCLFSMFNSSTSGYESSIKRQILGFALTKKHAENWILDYQGLVSSRLIGLEIECGPKNRQVHLKFKHVIFKTKRGRDP